jgi:hypothetical protein
VGERQDARRPRQVRVPRRTPRPLGDAPELGTSNPRALGTVSKPAHLAQKLVSGT